MDITMIYGPLLKLAFVILAFITLEKLMKRHDRRADVNYMEILKIIKSDPKATALYFGIVYFTVAYVLAAVIL